MATSTFPDSTAGGRQIQISIAAAILAIVLGGFAVLALYAVHEIQVMATDLQSVSASLGAMRTQLNETNQSLRETNRSLHTTNAKLDITNRATSGVRTSVERMETDIKALGAMRGDIHEMAHKLSGSFLFRGVK